MPTACDTVGAGARQRVVNPAGALRAQGAWAERLAEVANPLARCWKCKLGAEGPGVLPLLIRGKGKDLVLHDRPAEREPINAQLRPPARRLVRSGDARERGVGESVEAWVAPVMVGRAVPIIRPRLHVHADDAARAVALLGVNGVLREGDLFNGV